MIQSGITPESRPVMAGVGTLCFTKGVPLEIILTVFQDKGFVVDWVDYIMTALNDGHNPRTIRARIESAVSDVYGKDYTKEVMARVDRVLEVLA